MTSIEILTILLVLELAALLHRILSSSLICRILRIHILFLFLKAKRFRALNIAKALKLLRRNSFVFIKCDRL